MTRHCKICEYFLRQEEAKIVSGSMPLGTLRGVYSAPTYVQEPPHFRLHQNWKTHHEAAENVQ